jgi:Ribbon-helix-helix protein
LAAEDRTARLTILVDPGKEELFERLCVEEDATPSQVVRRLIRRYIEERMIVKNPTLVGESVAVVRSARSSLFQNIMPTSSNARLCDVSLPAVPKANPAVVSLAPTYENSARAKKILFW